MLTLQASAQRPSLTTQLFSLTPLLLPSTESPLSTIIYPTYTVSVYSLACLLAIYLLLLAHSSLTARALPVIFGLASKFSTEQIGAKHIVE